MTKTPAIEFGTLHPNGEVTDKKTLNCSTVDGCPYTIFSPSHYRKDGSCKCNDPNETIMIEWGYTWDDKLKMWG